MHQFGYALGVSKKLQNSGLALYDEKGSANRKISWRSTTE
jgi:hypothetical protein